MKKLITPLIAALLCTSLCSCGAPVQDDMPRESMTDDSAVSSSEKSVKAEEKADNDDSEASNADKDKSIDADE